MTEVFDLVVDQVHQHSMFLVSKDVACCLFHRSVLPLADEATETSSDKQHALMEV